MEWMFCFTCDSVFCQYEPMQSEPTIQCVVARYREDVSWTADLGLPVVVYDKSGADPLSGTVPLPNVGRESHTYLQHIVRRYPEFPDYTLFLQGDPFPHLESGMDASGLGALARKLAARGMPFKGMAYYTLKCDHLGRPHQMKDPRNKGKWAGWNKDIPVGRVYQELFQGPVPLQYHAKGCAGLFLVSRTRILTRPLATYQRALDLVLADPQDANNTGHAFERLWSVIFNGYAKLNRE